MDEVTDQPPERGSHPPIAAARARLSPVQAAHARYSTHTGGCPRCSDIDRDRCPEGDRLWRAWNDACDDAYRKLHGAR